MASSKGCIGRKDGTDLFKTDKDLCRLLKGEGPSREVCRLGGGETKTSSNPGDIVP